MPDNTNFKEELELANEKYERFKRFDPYPKIAPALLNSDDIIKYVNTIGMINPFHEDKVHLKPATYAIELLGKIVFWDNERKKIVIDLKRKERFILKSNSIAFVTLEPFLRLPDYIAARFNLKINNVYKGLLLGTGPIVDPGYCGKLSIPLHNLTTNNYEFTGGERIIWMEFTKLSQIPDWQNDKNEYETKGFYFYNTETHKDWDVEDFLTDAHDGPIDSSLPRLKYETEETIKSFITDIINTKTEINLESDKLNSNIKTINVGIIFSAAGFLGVLIALIALFCNWLIDYKKDIKEYLNKKVELQDYSIDKKLNSSIQIHYLEIHKQDSTDISKLKEKIQKIEEQTNTNRNSRSSGSR